MRRSFARRSGRCRANPSVVDSHGSDGRQIDQRRVRPRRDALVVDRHLPAAPAMSRRILVIDDAASAFEPVLAQCVPSAKVVRCAPREWRATAARFDLLMPVALAPAPHWSTLFDALKRRAAAAPVLAVVGAEAGADVLTAAARAADDFMIWSADRASELRQRIVRLFGPMEYVRAITENLTRDAALGQMIGEDAAFQSMLDRVP